MYENLCGVRFKGEMFDNEREFSFFSNEGNNNYPTRVGIIYGKNGSGKSTITKAFQKCADESITTISSASLYNFEKELITERDDIKQNIFVFNEEFIERNVKIKEEGLETIVMFGEQADLEGTIDNLNVDRERKREEYKIQEEKIKEFNDEKNIQSPSYYWRKLRSSLQGDDNWAGIDRQIKGQRGNSPVNDTLINAIVSQTVSSSEKELKVIFSEKKRSYEHLKNQGKLITSQVAFPNLNVEEDKVWELLAIKIEKPELTKREELILDLVMQGKQAHFISVHDSFSNHDVDQCPFCLQHVSEEYKHDLIVNINNVLSKEVENHILDLKKMRIKEFSFDFDPYVVLGSIVEECKEILQQVNEVFSQLNGLIDKKIENTYIPIEKRNFSLDKLLTLLNEKFESLENLRKDYNQKFSEIEPLKLELIELNKQIAYYSVNSIYQEYVKQLELKDIEDKKMEDILAEGQLITSQLKELQEKQKSIKIAVDHINNGLRYIFFSNNRLSIETNEDRYILFSRGRPVKPNDISCGERNILALCYFFTQIMKNEKEKNMYKKETLIVIDDPVSSFDLENKVGILSYLKSQLLKVLSGNKYSRVLLFSHDLATMYDLIKQFEEIKESIKIMNNEGKKDITTNFSILELDFFDVKQFSYRKRNEYTSLIETIYDFCVDTSEQNDIAIGNIMRRVLEAFATFEYKKGIDSISCDTEILSSMGNPIYSQYFENLMYRLILNGESHFEERLKSLPDLNFYATVSLEEKKRTAKDVLCLINVLNRNHLKAHLMKKDKGIEDVDSWCQDILKQI